VPTSTTDANGRTTTLTYDPLGRLTAVRLPGDAYDTKTFAYTVSTDTPSTVVTSSYPAAGAAPVRSWSFLDSLGRAYQTQVAGPTGGTITTGTRFDERGNPAATVAAFSSTNAPGTVYGQWYDPAFTATLPSQTVGTYDDDDREVTASLVAAGATKWTTTTGYDATSSTVTPASNGGAGQPDIAATTATSDLDGHVVSRTQNGATTRYGYDLAGNLTSITSPAGKVTTYGYDWLGRRTTTSDPDAGSATSDYYPSGAVKHTRDAAGTDLYTTIDALSRPTATYTGTSASGALLTQTVYDATPLGASSPLLGTITSQTSYLGSTPGSPGTPGTGYTQAFGYDTRYRVTRTDQTLPSSVGTGLAGTYSTTSTFDGLNRPTTVTYPAAGGLAGETVTTGYTGAYPTTLTSPSASYVSATTYTGIGQVATQILGTATATGSVQRAHAWDPATGRLTAQAAATPSNTGTANLQSNTYTYSPTGDLTKITDGVVGQQQCYSYDPQDRLVGALTSTATGTPGTKAGNTCTGDSTGPTPYSEVYAYDADANLTSLTHNGITKTYTYATNTGLGVTGGPHAPTATTTGGATTTYSYNPNGQLTTKTAGGVTSSYTWDPQGRLASATIGGATSTFTYGPDGTRWLRATPTETVAYLAGQELHQPTGATSATAIRYYTLAGTTVGVRKTGTSSGGLYWLLTDQQGSLSLSVNATDATFTQDRYLPYGGSRATTAPLFTLPTDRGWIGQTQDKDTGLDYLNARYYDPQLAHFISTDPLNIQTNPATANPYTYATDNPITYTDPNGAVALGTDGYAAHMEQARQQAAARARALAAQRAAAAAAAARAAAARAAAERAEAAREAARNRREAAVVAAKAAAARASAESGSVSLGDGSLFRTSSGAGTKGGGTGTGSKIGSVIGTGVGVGVLLSQVPNPGGGTSTRSDRRDNEIAVDNNIISDAVTDPILGARIDAQLNGRHPVVSPRARMEFLEVKGRSAAPLDAWLAARGGRYGAMPSEDDVERAQGEFSTGIVLGSGKRVLKQKDAEVLASARIERLPVMTADVRFYRGMVAMPYPAELFVFANPLG
jgi:RHS repeat-associated protein